MAEEIVIHILAKDDASATMRRVSGAAGDMDSKVRASGGGFSALGSAASAGMAVVAGAAVAGTAAMGGFLASSVQAAGTFEASVNGLAAVAGDSLAQAGFSLDDVSAKALQLGQDTAYSAQEAIQAMTELAKGGVPIQSVMTDATDATLALAAAAGVDLANAAEIVAKQLGVWSETGVTASDVTDLIASAANASTVGVEDLALGLAQAGGTAKTAGVEFSDLVQTMALIAPNFSSASDAGTSLKTFLSRLIPTTEGAKAAMAELGLYTEETGSAFFDANGQFVGMEAAARMLQGATSGLSEEQKLLAFNTIFGADAIRAAAAIANAGADGFTAMGTAMEASGGAAAAAAIKNQGFGFAMEQLKGSVETLQIVIGTALLPMLTQVIGQFTAGVNAVLTFAQAALSSGDPLAYVGAQVATLSGQFPMLGSAIATAQAAFASIASFIATIMPSIQGIVTSALTLIQGFWQAHGATILQVAQSVWQAIQGVIQVVLGVIQGLLGVAMVAMTGEWSAGGEQIRAANEMIWTGISNFLQGILNSIAAFFGTSLSELVSLWQSNFDQLVNIAGTVAGQVLDTLAQMVSEAPGIGSALIDGIKEGLNGALGGLVAAAAAAAKKALDAAKSALGIQSPSKVFAEQVGRPIVEGMAKGMTDNLLTVQAAAANLAKQATSAAQGAIGAPTVGAASPAMAGAMGDVMRRAMTAVPVVASGALGQAMAGGAKTTNISGGITINAAPGQNANQIADAVIRRINSQVQGRR